MIDEHDGWYAFGWVKNLFLINYNFWYFYKPKWRIVAIYTCVQAYRLTLSGPLIERTEMKRKIYLSEAWILLWIRLKSPDVGPERVKIILRHEAYLKKYLHSKVRLILTKLQRSLVPYIPLSWVLSSLLVFRVSVLHCVRLHCNCC